jgi:FkbM family methyltransferase
MPIQPHSLRISFQDGSVIRLAHPFASSTGKNAFVTGRLEFETETVSVFERLMHNCRFFFDVGANVGVYSLLAAASHPNAEIFAFEPEPQLFRLLCASIDENRFSQIHPERLALGEHDGEAILYVTTGSDNESSLNPTYRSATRPEACTVRTLDSYCEQRGITEVQLIKADTESTEPEVLRGAQRLLASSRPDILCEVLYGHTEPQLMEILEPLGYRYFHLLPEGPTRRERIHGDPTFRYRNYLFTCRSDP